MVPTHQEASGVEVGGNSEAPFLNLQSDSGGGVGGRHIRTRKCSKVTFSPVQGKEKDKARDSEFSILTWPNNK